jgi:transaldolase/glucose-6-phosphate isomerase
VLSKFGLAPAAAIGLDVRRLLETTRTMQRSCGADVPPSENPGVHLGVAMGVAATRFGRDKVTIIASPGVADFGAWLEQLLAESTGKQGRGLIPLAGEPLTVPEGYGSDRFFAYLELEGRVDSSQRQAVEALERAGHPVAKISVKDVWHIGQEFFRWEIATAVAGAVLGINPFDQPDVASAKEATNRVLATGLPDIDLVKTGTVLDQVRPGDYVAIQLFGDPDDPDMSAIERARHAIRDRLRVATTVGIGPRFLHSTGQLHKGGPPSGVFIQMVGHDHVDVPIPNRPYGFSLLKQAQAAGDLLALQERGLRAGRVDIHEFLEALA